MRNQRIYIEVQNFNPLRILFEEYYKIEGILVNPQGLVSILVFQYCYTLYLTLLNSYSKILWIPLHILYVMVFWSSFKCIVSDPGRVPKNYGMLLDDQAEKKERYCLLCHHFQPERCHHCSKCRRCVLNMSYHNSWYGNCQGFYNQKFDLLLQFYFSLSTIFSLIIVDLQGMDLLFRDQEPKIQSIILTFILLFYLFAVSILSSISLTLLIKEVITNTTRINWFNLDWNQVNVYDIKYRIYLFFIVKENWFKVMGTNPWLWPFPMFGESGRPKGDGITWQRIQN